MAKRGIRRSITTALATVTCVVISGAAVAIAPAGAGASEGGAALPAMSPGLLSIGALKAAPLVAIGTSPRLPAGTQDLGPLPRTRQMHFGVALAPRDPIALTAAATAMSTPGQRPAGGYLTPAQFRSRFGPSASETADVASWLTYAGLQVGAPSANGLLMPVTGTVGAIEQVLKVQLFAGRLPGTKAGWEAGSAPLLPSPVAPGVAAILGLDNLATPRSGLVRPHGHTPVAAALPSHQLLTATPHACQAAADGAARYGGWTFDQIAQAYGLGGIYDEGAGQSALGQGETVGIFELEPFAMSDISTFEKCYFGKSNITQTHVVAVDGGIPAGAGSGEATLDVEDVAALAPRAQIDVYEAPGTTYGGEYATDDTYNAMVSADKVNVISTSWGLCESELEQTAPGAQQVENEIFEEAALQGQSVFTPAGDAGSDDCSFTGVPTRPYLSVDDPASQPFVVAVGGTTLLSSTEPPVEQVWNDGAGGGGGGGGISATWRSPSWQSRSGVAGVSNSYSSRASYNFCSASPATPGVPGCREVPDVTLAADENHGSSFYMASSGGWSTIGGTSTATPMWAAITADITTASACSNVPRNPVSSSRDMGFIAPALYQAAAGSSAGTDFNDITSGSNDIFNLAKGYPATTGYDLASGLGSPVVTGKSGRAGLAAALCSLLGPVTPPPGTVTVRTLRPSWGSVNGGTTVMVHGSGFRAGTVVGVDFGGVPARSFSVVSRTELAAVSPGAQPRAGVGGAGGRTPGIADVTVSVSKTSGPTTTVVTSRPQPSSAFAYVTTSSLGAALPSVSGVGPSGGPLAARSWVTVYGSGFVTGGPVTEVTFGGVRSPSVRTLSNWEMRVLAPPKTKSTRCVQGPGYSPSTACQVYVIVQGRRGPSRPGRILPPYFGKTIPNSAGVVNPARGTEIDPAPSEYDYAPRPVITSISPNPQSISSTRPITIRGSGFSVLTLSWVNFGPAGQWADNDSLWLAVSPTSIVIQAPPYTGAPPARPVPLPGGVSVLSMGGSSNVVGFSYAKG